MSNAYREAPEVSFATTRGDRLIVIGAVIIISLFGEPGSAPMAGLAGAPHAKNTTTRD